MKGGTDVRYPINLIKFILTVVGLLYEMVNNSFVTNESNTEFYKLMISNTMKILRSLVVIFSVVYTIQLQ